MKKILCLLLAVSLVSVACKGKEDKKKCKENCEKACCEKKKGEEVIKETEESVEEIKEGVEEVKEKVEEIAK